MVKLKAYVNEKHCLSCGGCVSLCPQDAISLNNLIAVVTKEKCKFCKLCVNICPVAAISSVEV